MLKRATVALGLLATLCFHISPAYAGAWTQTEGQGLIATSATYYATGHYFDANGEPQSQRRFRKYGLNAYGEYGLTNTTTVGANLFLDSVKQAGRSNITISNTELFLRQRLYKDDTRVVSIQPLIKLPTISQHDFEPRGGSESTDAELALLYGESLKIISDHDFADSLIALRYRSDNLSAQYRAEARLGLYLTDQLLAIPAFYITQAISPEVSPFVQSGDLDYNLSKAEFSLLYKYTDNAYVQASAFSHVAGTLAGSGTGVTLSYGMSF